jgi:hypothetical protein
MADGDVRGRVRQTDAHPTAPALVGSHHRCVRLFAHREDGLRGRDGASPAGVSVTRRWSAGRRRPGGPPRGPDGAAQIRLRRCSRSAARPKCRSRHRHEARSCCGSTRSPAPTTHSHSAIIAGQLVLDLHQRCTHHRVMSETPVSAEDFELIRQQVRSFIRSRSLPARSRDHTEDRIPDATCARSRPTWASSATPSPPSGAASVWT